jgi:hypothetical protein
VCRSPVQLFVSLSITFCLARCRTKSQYSSFQIWDEGVKKFRSLLTLRLTPPEKSRRSFRLSDNGGGGKRKPLSNRNSFKLIYFPCVFKLWFMRTRSQSQLFILQLIQIIVIPSFAASYILI